MSKVLRRLRQLANKERVEAGLPPDKSPVEASSLGRRLALRPAGCSRPVASFCNVPDGLFCKCPGCGANQFASNGKCRKCGKKLEAK